MEKKKIRILLADDTLIAREGWRRILETDIKMEIVGESKSAQETPRKVLDLNPDVILMDLKWFGDPTAGWIAIREIKKSSPEVKIIAITAYENLIKDARLAGADAAITKTFSRDELLELIEGLSEQNNDFSIKTTRKTLLDDLTSREKDVLKLINRGDSNKEIADSLGIATTTVKNHVKNILEKLGAKNRTHAASIARKKGLF